MSTSLPKSMLAAKLYEPGAPLQMEETPLPTLAPGQALVEVRACGICGSDVHLWEGTLPLRQRPIVPGHEIAGVIAEVAGEAAAQWQAGARVIVRPGLSCGACRYCLSDREALCPQARVLGIDMDGGFAQYVVAPADKLVPLPPEIPFAQGAIMADAVATPFHALVERGSLQAGETVAVFGCGGLGIHAVQIAKLLGAGTVVAVDVRAGALARARAVGADYAVDASQEEAAKAIRRQLGEGVDLAVECVGHPQSIQQAVRSIAKGGRAVIVGIGQEPIGLPPPALFAWAEYAVIGSFGSGRRDLERVLELVRSGQLDLSASISACLPLAEATRGLQMLRDKEGDPVRIILEPAYR